MYAVIRKYKFDKKNAEKINAKVDQIFTPLLAKLPGFVTYYWFDGGDGTGASISVFEDKEGAEESVTKAADFVKKELSGLGMSGPEITQGEVRAFSQKEEDLSTERARPQTKPSSRPLEKH